MYNINRFKDIKDSLQKCISIVFLAAIFSCLSAQEYTCPHPQNNFYTARFTQRYFYASPGQAISVHVMVTGDPCPCDNPGDTWYAGGAMERQEGSYRWPAWVYPVGSDCFSQFWTIPVPFDFDDYSVEDARYLHHKAACIFIYCVVPYPEPDPCKTDGMDPVNTYLGSFRFTDEDYSNSDVNFSRHYDATMILGTYRSDTQKRWQNPMGIGWQHNYNIFIEEIQQVGTPTIHGCLLHEGKATEVYKKLPDDNYHPKRKNHSNLKKTGSTWKLYKSDGDIYYFGSSGKVDSIVDRNARKTTFSYSGNYLSQVTGKDGHTLSFGYNADSFLTTVSITENSNTKQFEYRYAPITYIIGDEEEADTFDLMGAMYLAQVLQHYPTGSADSLMSLHKYYYDGNNLKMVAKIIPDGSYTESDTVWTGNYKKGDRLYVWYDDLGRAIYQEVIDGDADTLLSNDKVTYKAYTSYYRYTNYQPGNDSALTYVYKQNAGVDSAHSPYDTTFTPQVPTSNYWVRKRDYSNDAVGRQIFIETRDGATSVNKYCKDLDFNDTLFVSPDNDTTRYTYQSYTLNSETRYTRLPTKIVYPTGDSALYYYHTPDNNAPAFSLLDSTIDELSRKTEYFYDDNYNLDSLRYVSRYVAGVGTTTVTTDYTYNSKGNLTQVKDPLDNSTYFSYAPNDTGSYLTKTRIDMSPSGSGNEDIIAKYKYNTDIGKTDTLVYFRDYPGDSSIIRYTYDVMNRSKEIFYPDNTKDVFTYDKRGNLLKKETYESSTQHFLIKYEYDARDRLVKVKEYANLEVSQTYDSTVYKYNLNDELIGFVNANDTAGISTEIKYTYDAGRLIEVEYADTTRDSLGYYQNGNLKFKEDRRGKVMSYVYDDRDRLTKKRYFNSFAAYQGFPDSVPAETLKFSYDDVGNMISMLDKNGTMSYSYDEMNGLDTLNCYQNMLVIYEYDKAGNKKKLKVVKASDTTTVYLEQTYPTYDEANRLKRTAVGTDTFEFTYWDTGPIKKIDYPNGLKEQYWLTNRNFIDSMRTYDSGTSNSLFRFVYRYNSLADRDSVYLKISRILQAPVTGEIKYSYDDLRRLTGSKTDISGIADISYTYDPIGNRLTKKQGKTTTNYTYNKRNNHMTYAGATGYSYDNNGNMTQITPPEEIDYYFTWDFENRLIKTRKLGSGTHDSLEFTYCGMGKRIRKIHYTADDTTKYCYDGMYAVCEFGGHLDLQAKYVYANGMLLARYDESPADTHFYHRDGLGSIIGMTNENANVEQSYFYDDFGNSLGSWGNVNNHYLYTGQEYDGSISTLYNLRARYYDPGVGRFVSEDPFLGAQHSCYMSRCFTSLTYLQQVRLFEPMELNAYLYCGNNPTNNRDITGLQADWYAACATVAGCILEECKKNIPPDYPCRSEEKEKCVDEAYDWLLDCLRYKTTPLPPLPYYAYLCLGLINELFPYE